MTSNVVKHARFGKFYQHKTTQRWWTKDQAGHGGSVWKVYRKQDDKLVHEADANEFWDYLKYKHKGAYSETIPWKEFSGASL